MDDTPLGNASWVLNYMEQTWAQSKDFSRASIETVPLSLPEQTQFHVRTKVFNNTSGVQHFGVLRPW